MDGLCSDGSNNDCKAFSEEQLTAPAASPSPKGVDAPAALLVQSGSQKEGASSASASLVLPACMPASSSSAYVWTYESGLAEVTWDREGVKIEDCVGTKWLSARCRGGLQIKDVMSGRDLGGGALALSADPRKVTETGAEVSGAYGLSLAESGAKYLYDVCVELRQAHAARGWTAEDARMLQEQGQACLQKQRRYFLEGIPSALVKACGKGYEGVKLDTSKVFQLPENLYMMTRGCSDGTVRVDAMEYVAWLVSADAKDSLEATYDPRLALLGGLVHDVDAALGSHFSTALDGASAVIIVRMRHVPHPLL